MKANADDDNVICATLGKFKILSHATACHIDQRNLPQNLLIFYLGEEELYFAMPYKNNSNKSWKTI